MWTTSLCVKIRHGYRAQGYEAKAKPKLWSNHEAEAEAEALTFWKHEAEAEAEALAFSKHEAEAEAQVLPSYLDLILAIYWISGKIYRQTWFENEPVYTEALLLPIRRW